MSLDSRQLYISDLGLVLALPPEFDGTWREYLADPKRRDVFRRGLEALAKIKRARAGYVHFIDPDRAFEPGDESAAIVRRLQQITPQPDIETPQVPRTVIGALAAGAEDPVATYMGKIHTKVASAISELDKLAKDESFPTWARQFAEMETQLARATRQFLITGSPIPRSVIHKMGEIGAAVAETVAKPLAAVTGSEMPTAIARGLGRAAGRIPGEVAGFMSSPAGIATTPLMVMGGPIAGATGVALTAPGAARAAVEAVKHVDEPERAAEAAGYAIAGVAGTVGGARLVKQTLPRPTALQQAVAQVTSAPKQALALPPGGAPPHAPLPTPKPERLALPQPREQLEAGLVPEIAAITEAWRKQSSQVRSDIETELGTLQAQLHRLRELQDALKHPTTAEMPGVAEFPTIEARRAAVASELASVQDHISKLEQALDGLRQAERNPEYLRDLLQSNPALAEVWQQSQGRIAATANRIRSQLGALTRRRAALDKQLKRIEAAAEAGTEDAVSAARQLEAQIKAIDEELNQLRQEYEQLKPFLTKPDRIAEFYQRIASRPVRDAQFILERRVRVLRPKHPTKEDADAAVDKIVPGQDIAPKQESVPPQSPSPQRLEISPHTAPEARVMAAASAPASPNTVAESITRRVMRQIAEVLYYPFRLMSSTPLHELEVMVKTRPQMEPVVNVFRRIAEHASAIERELYPEAIRAISHLNRLQKTPLVKMQMAAGGRAGQVSWIYWLDRIGYEFTTRNIPRTEQNFRAIANELGVPESMTPDLEIIWRFNMATGQRYAAVIDGFVPSGKVERHVTSDMLRLLRGRTEQGTPLAEAWAAFKDGMWELNRERLGEMLDRAIQTLEAGGDDALLRVSELVLATPAARRAYEVATATNTSPATAIAEALKQYRGERLREFSDLLIDAWSAALQDRLFNATPELHPFIFAQLSQDFNRFFPHMLTHVKAGRTWLELLHSSPVRHIEHSAVHCAQTVAFRNTFREQGQLVDFMKLVSERVPPTAATLVSEVIRDLQGLPPVRESVLMTDNTVLRMGITAFRTVNELFKSMALSALSLTQLPETVIGIPTAIGIRPFIGGLYRLITRASENAADLANLKNEFIHTVLHCRTMIDNVGTSDRLAAQLQRLASQPTRVLGYMSGVLNNFQLFQASAAVAALKAHVRAAINDGVPPPRWLVEHVHDMFRMCGLTDEMASAALAGNETAWNAFASRLPTAVYGPQRFMFERPFMWRGELGRITRVTTVFWQYFVAHMRRGIHRVRELARALETGDAAGLRRQSLYMARWLAGELTMGAALESMLSWLYYGRAGAEQQQRNLETAPFRTLFRWYAQRASQPFYILGSILEGRPLTSVFDMFAWPFNITSELWAQASAFVGGGPLSDVPLKDRIKLGLYKWMAAYRVAGRALQPGAGARTAIRQLAANLGVDTEDVDAAVDMLVRTMAPYDIISADAETDLAYRTLADYKRRNKIGVEIKQYERERMAIRRQLRIAMREFTAGPHGDPFRILDALADAYGLSMGSYSAEELANPDTRRQILQRLAASITSTANQGLVEALPSTLPEAERQRRIAELRRVIGDRGLVKIMINDAALLTLARMVRELNPDLLVLRYYIRASTIPVTDRINHARGLLAGLDDDTKRRLVLGATMGMDPQHRRAWLEQLVPGMTDTLAKIDRSYASLTSSE